MIILGCIRAESAAGDHVLCLSWKAASCTGWKPLLFLLCHNRGCLATANVGVGLNEPNPARLIVTEWVLMQRE